jgi:hypothetical protein
MITEKVVRVFTHNTVSHIYKKLFHSVLVAPLRLYFNPLCTMYFIASSFSNEDDLMHIAHPRFCSHILPCTIITCVSVSFSGSSDCNDGRIECFIEPVMKAQ